MKKNKINSTLFFISAVAFYLAAIIYFAIGNHNSMGVVWLCLGSTFLCLGSVYVNKSKDNNDDKEKKE